MLIIYSSLFHSLVFAIRTVQHTHKPLPSHRSISHTWLSRHLNPSLAPIFGQMASSSNRYFQQRVLDWFLSAWFLDYYVVGLLSRGIYSVQFFLLGLLSAVCESVDLLGDLFLVNKVNSSVQTLFLCAAVGSSLHPLRNPQSSL